MVDINWLVKSKETSTLNKELIITELKLVSNAQNSTKLNQTSFLFESYEQESRDTVIDRN